MGAFREIASAAKINNSYTSLLKKKTEGGGDWTISNVACPNWSDSKPEQTPTADSKILGLSENEHH